MKKIGLINCVYFAVCHSIKTVWWVTSAKFFTPLFAVNVTCLSIQSFYFSFRVASIIMHFIKFSNIHCVKWMLRRQKVTMPMHIFAKWSIFILQSESKYTLKCFFLVYLKSNSNQRFLAFFTDRLMHSVHTFWLYYFVPRLCYQLMFFIWIW